MEVDEKLKKYIQEKIDMLEKYLGSIQIINCDFEVETAVGNQNSGKIYRAEMNLDLPGELIRIEKSASDIYKAVDKVKDHAPRSIKRYKEKKLLKRSKK